MRELVLATENKHKIIEMRKFFADNYTPGYKIITMAEAGFTEKTAEDADTFEGNARKKALAVCAYSGKIALADDSGLSVDFLNGAPGVRSARYAGENASGDENIDKLLHELEGVPERQRGARFVCVICVCFPDGRSFTVKGECGGRILTGRRGGGDFGYDPVFFYPPLNSSFAELSLEEKNKISHRGLALEKLKQKPEMYIF